MKLINIIKQIDCKVVGSVRRKIFSLEHIASKACNHSIFFCLNGKSSNGKDYLNEAINNGCKVIVTQESIPNLKITQIIVSNARQAMSQIAAIFYGEPAKKLKIIGVTGTNGKTTTTNMIAHILKSKYKVGIIGTNGAFFASTKIDTGFTTPDPIILQEILANMLASGVEFVVMEISAHAIYLQKLWGIMCHIVAFTNLSQDHLDYFETMDKYLDAKKQLFIDSNYSFSVVCTDTDYGKNIASVSKNCITCSSINKNADIFISSKEHTITNQKFSVSAKNGSGDFLMKLLGNFNLQNAIVAIAVCLKIGMTFDEISAQLETLNGVDGRFECYSNDKVTIVVDYAHTPDGLKNLLQTAKEIAGRNKVISIFGCGGNRDTEKRPIMAKVSQDYADYTIVTTDNPRFEDNYRIAKDIVKGFTSKKWEVVLDRGQALRRGIALSKSGDIVVLAGKGAEEYLDVCGKKIDYSDKTLATKVLEENDFI